MRIFNKMRFFTSLLITNLVNVFLNTNFCVALDIPIRDIVATPEKTISSANANFSGKITLTEISFKNEEHDYIKFIVQSETDKVNLQNIEFIDDKIFKTIETPFVVNSGSEITLTFNSGEKDNSTTNQLYTTKKGLTATTEQILLKHNNEPLAFFCWIKSPPSKTESASFPKIVPTEIWEEPDIENCFNSETVKTNQVIKKVFEENNSSAWEIFQEKAPDSENPRTVQENLTELIETAPIQTSTTPVIQITEIYPLPQKNEIEWVELESFSPDPINLNNWIIDDSEGGSKPKQLSSLIIREKQTIIINLKELKINLNNDTDSIRLFTPEGVEVDSREYSGGKKGESYSLISIDGQENWQWTDSPTPGKENPKLETKEITVSTAPIFDDKIYYFVGELNEEQVIVTFSEDKIKAPLAQEMFKTGATFKIVGEISLLPDNNNDYKYTMLLYDFELVSQNDSPINIYVWGIFLIIIAGASIYYFITKSNIVNTEELV